MNTEFIKKPVRQHGNKLAHGFSAAMLVFLYATFATKSDVERIDRAVQRAEEKRATQWQKIMDHEVALARLGRVGLANTNPVAVKFEPKPNQK